MKTDNKAALAEALTAVNACPALVDRQVRVTAMRPPEGGYALFLQSSEGGAVQNMATADSPAMAAAFVRGVERGIGLARGWDE